MENRRVADITDNYLKYGRAATDIYYIKTRYSQIGDESKGLKWLDVEMTDIVTGEWMREHIAEVAKRDYDACAVLQEACDEWHGLKYHYPNVRLIWFLITKYVDENSVIYNVSHK